MQSEDKIKKNFRFGDAKRTKIWNVGTKYLVRCKDGVGEK